MVDKEIEEGLAEINVDDKEGTIDAIEVKESNNTQEMGTITLKIKRRRKVKGSGNTHLKELSGSDQEYERINPDTLVEPATLQ